MSDEATNAEATPQEGNPEAQEEVVQDVESVADDTSTEQSETQAEETPQEVEGDAEAHVDLDLYEQARKQNEELKAQLEELEQSDTNVFEQNEILKKKIEDAQKAKELAAENAKLTSQLDKIKQASLVDSMLAGGQLTPELKEWAESQTYENLQAFAKSAPKHKTILNEKNPVDETETDAMKDFRETHCKSGILG